MIRFTLLQARVQLIIALLGLAMVAAVLISTQNELANAITLCTKNKTCDESIPQSYLDLHDMLNMLIVSTPALIGMFWGAPLASREFENATHRLVWTQSVTRTRWLVTKLGCLTLLAMAFTSALSLMVSEWGQGLTTQGLYTYFDVRDIVPIASAAFAFVFGVSIGLFLKRLVPAMVITLIAYVMIANAFPNHARPHLMSPAERTTRIADNDVMLTTSFDERSVEVQIFNASIPNALVMSTKLVDRNNQILSASRINAEVTRMCPGILRPVLGDPRLMTEAEAEERMLAEEKCLDDMNRVYQLRTTYHPASHYWTLQWIESGLYIALTLLLAGISIAYIRHNPA